MTKRQACLHPLPTVTLPAPSFPIKASELKVRNYATALWVALTSQLWNLEIRSKPCRSRLSAKAKTLNHRTSSIRHRFISKVNSNQHGLALKISGKTRPVRITRESDGNRILQIAMKLTQAIHRHCMISISESRFGLPMKNRYRLEVIVHV